MLHVHGDRDRVVPYAGGPLPPTLAPGRRLPGTDATLSPWVRANGCQGPAHLAGRADLTAGLPGEETRLEAWPGCRGGTVQRWTVEGGGHLLQLGPETLGRMLDALLGRTSGG